MKKKAAVIIFYNKEKTTESVDTPDLFLSSRRAEGFFKTLAYLEKVYLTTYAVLHQRPVHAHTAAFPVT